MPAQNNPNGTPENLQIKQWRVVADVVQVVLRVQVHQLVAAAVDLPPAGHPRRDGEALALPTFIALHQEGQFGARAAEGVAGLQVDKAAARASSYGNLANFAGEALGGIVGSIF